ncbi:hypothetical protein [Acinetobacter sp. HY1485]|uniref:hypothetical protein n=1 Tax=Acinetobacter sp. HY1485 TaxID=2970918 RepID=UPI0022B95629|nr:hypothetical protein [Acinetobacter sp. HY1485]
MSQLTPEQYQKNYDDLELEVEQIKDSFLEDIFLSDEQEELLNQLIKKSIELGMYNKAPYIASLKTEIESLKVQYQSDDYVRVPKSDINFFWQDNEEPENLCSSACGDDIECLGHNLDLGEIMAINKTHEVILKTEEIFGTWYAEVDQPHLKANFHIGTHEECLAIVAKNTALTEVQEQDEN